MGISCEINLCKPPDGVFHSGELVTGKIKYALDEPMGIETITVSLKGHGQLRLTERANQKNTRNYRNSEIYVDTDDVIHEGKTQIPAGSYEIDFSFRLPHNIPPTFEYYNNVPRYRVNCRIKYYVRIRFDRTGWLSLAKHFKKEITVTSPVMPKLMTEPVIYGEKKVLKQLFSKKTSAINIKANIATSVIPVGGKIAVDYEIENDSKLVIKGVETKLLEMYTFKAHGYKEVKTYEDVPDAETKTGSVKSGETQVMSIELRVPSDKISLDHSDMVTRNFAVRITAELPMPHRNMVLEMPLQVGNVDVREEVFDPPPSYWENMREDNNKKHDGMDEDRNP